MPNKLLDPSTLKLTFDDEFDSFTSSPMGTVGWMTQYPFWGASRTLALNHEAEYLSDSSVGVNPFTDANGILTISATPATGAAANALGLPYNSGVITTYKSFAQLYGYFEIRAQLPAGAGLWPAFWMLPLTGVGATELDIFEVLGDKPNILHATTHSSSGTNVSQALAVADTSAGFHTYGVDWGPTTVTFYMDGQAIAAAATPSDMNVPMYMLVTLAVGGVGSWPGATNASTTIPANMQVDYVRAYATADTLGTTDPNPQIAAAVLPAVQAPLVAGRGWIGVTVLHYGNQDPGSRQAGIGVELLNGSGQVVATGVTGSDGTYIFTGVAAGTYRIKYVPPSNLTLQPGSQADITTGMTATFSLANGQGLSLINQKVLSTAQLAGLVQSGTAGVPGVLVTLLDSSKTLVATTTTDSAGRFSFPVVAATYYVQYTPVAGSVLQTGGHADPVTGLSPPITLASGQAFLLAPEVLVVQPATLQGSVMLASGTAPAGEGGVAVALVSSTGTTVAATATTSTGAFSFAGIAPGSYQLRYTAPANQVFAAGSAADTTTGLTTMFTASAGQTLTLATETLTPTPLGKMSGTVLEVARGVTAPEAAITVSLLNMAGAVVATSRTTSTGAWSFAGVAAGTYRVSFAMPAGHAVQSGPAASSDNKTATSGVLTLGAGQALALAAETFLLLPTTISGSVLHYGQGDAGTGQGGVAVSLLNASGAVVATGVTGGDGSFAFSNLALGSYQVRYAAPSWEVFQARPADPAPGLSPLTTLSYVGQQFPLVHETLLSTSNSFTETGPGARALRGDGNYTVTGDASNATLTLGKGNQSVTLSGSGNAVTVGAGNSTISVGSGSTVHAGGGLTSTTTVSAVGGHNTLDVASGMAFLQTDGSAADVFMLNAKGQGLVTISGFDPGTSEILNLTRTLAGIDVGSSFERLGTYVSASTAGGDTTLLIDPTGGQGTAAAVAVLKNVSTTVAQLVSGHHVAIG